MKNENSEGAASGDSDCDTTSIQPPSKKSKMSRASKFDEFFEYTAVNKKDKIAICKLCTSRVQIKMKQCNTSGVKKHLMAKHQLQYNSLFTDPQTSTAAETRSSLSKFLVTQDASSTWNDMIVKWISMKYLPFNFFDDDLTQNIFKYLNKNIILPKRTNLQQLTMQKFTDLREKLKNLFENNSSNISLTVDGWTSISNKSYYGITAHFVDKNWILQSLVLDFVPSNGNHTGRDIAFTIFNSLKDYNIINKIQAITLDNTAANTLFIQELSKLINSYSDDINNFCETDSHFRCFAHIINLAIQDILKIINKTETDDYDFDAEESVESDETLETNDLPPLLKLRKLFIKIKYSEQWQNKLKSCCEASNVKLLSTNIDISTRWHSTHDMIATAVRMQPALNALCENNFEIRSLKIKENEWKLFAKVQPIFKHFKNVSTVLGGEKYVTLPLVIVGFNMLLDKLEVAINELQIIAVKSDVDTILLNGYQAAYMKLMKHYSKTNWLYCAILILDPRHKVKTFDMTKWGREMKDASIQKFEATFLNKYYKSADLEDGKKSSSSGSDDQDDDLIDICSLYKKVSTDNKKDNWRYEIDMYLNSPREGRNEDVLNWWNKHQASYPMLAKMARDLLSIPATSVPAERLFSRAGLTIRKHRNRLSHDSARSLLCLNSWYSTDILSSAK